MVGRPAGRPRHLTVMRAQRGMADAGFPEGFEEGKGKRSGHRGIGRGIAGWVVWPIGGFVLSPGDRRPDSPLM